MPTKKATKKTVPKTASKAVKKTTKKAVRKTTAKASAAKKSTKAAGSKASKKKLAAAKPDQAFWVSDGQVLSDLLDLEAAFGSMADTVFIYHANQEKNDFADWVDQVLDDEACAADLRSCRKPRSAKTVVRRHLKLYQE